MQIVKEFVPIIAALVFLIPVSLYVCYRLFDLLGRWCHTRPAPPKYFRAMMYNILRCVCWVLLLILFLRLSENDFIKKDIIPDGAIVCDFVAAVMNLLICCEVTFFLKNWFLLRLQPFFKVYEPSVLDFKKMVLSQKLASKETFFDRLNFVLQLQLVGSIISIFLMVTEALSTEVKFILLAVAAMVIFFCRGFLKSVSDGVGFQVFYHPFDVGNVCEIDGEVLMVMDLRILDTVFLTLVGDILYFPNKHLWSKTIHVL